MSNLYLKQERKFTLVCTSLPQIVLIIIYPLSKKQILFSCFFFGTSWINYYRIDANLTKKFGNIFKEIVFLKTTNCKICCTFWFVISICKNSQSFFESFVNPKTYCSFSNNLQSHESIKVQKNLETSIYIGCFKK